jgi:16S rRNA G966 N2-methylase RsmD
MKYLRQIKTMSNELYYGDNLEVLRKYIKDESIDLCYIDPPFNSKSNYNQIYNNIGKKIKPKLKLLLIHGHGMIMLIMV